MEQVWRVLNIDAKDVLELNDFWLRAPKQVWLYFEVSQLSGGWSLRLESKYGIWRVGDYIDGDESRELLYSFKLVGRRGAYRNKNMDELVMVELGNDVEIVLPRPIEPKFIIKFPLICRKALADLFIGQLDELFVVDCERGVKRFKKKEELADYLLKKSPRYAILTSDESSEFKKAKEGHIAEETVKKILKSL